MIIVLKKKKVTFTIQILFFSLNNTFISRESSRRITHFLEYITNNNNIFANTNNFQNALESYFLETLSKFYTLRHFNKISLETTFKYLFLIKERLRTIEELKEAFILFLKDNSIKEKVILVETENNLTEYTFEKGLKLGLTYI